MPRSVPPRIKRAVDALQLSPGDRILEVGCGTGLGVELVCERLKSGRITGIDRSASAIAAAKQRNGRHLRSGLARLRHTALADYPDAPERFDKVFAVNVNVFWLAPAAELRVICRILAPRGRLYLFYEPPSASQVPRIAQACRRFLEDGGFRVLDTVRRERGSSPWLAMVAAANAATDRGKDAQT